MHLLALSLLLAGPIPDTCPMPRPEEAPCAAKATTFDAGICTACTLRRVASQQEGRAATCNAALGSCQEAAVRDPAVPGWITTVASTAVAAAGAVAYADGHHTTGAVMVAVGIVGDGVGLLLLR